MAGLFSSSAIGTLSTQVGRLSFAATDLGLVAVCWGSPDELVRDLDRRSAQADVVGSAQADVVGS
ncbi:MAG: hypothetical protein QOK10_1747, partial [Pseudonocardiales bacterium]|nr:hypothetical protein [Pseudonocardiales bacterium]